MILTNFHTHTTRCKHAAPDREEDYILAAIEGGFTLFGFSDHTPWPYEKQENMMRMDPEELDGYIETVRALGEKYKDKLTLKCGLECEYFPEYLDWLRDTAKEKELDYLILGNHFDLTDHGGKYFGAPSCADDVRLYGQRTAAGIRTGMFAYVAHPDLPMAGRREFDDAAKDMAEMICRAALETGTLLEYNLAGLEYTFAAHARGGQNQGYPCDGFWRVAADMGCTAILGCDSHRAEHILHCSKHEYPESVKYLEKLGIRRVESIF